MILTNDNLQAMASGGVVGPSWPYDRGSEQDIESYLKNVVAELGRSRILEVDAEFMHYGSGFASFVHVFCYKRNDKSTVHNMDMDCTDGIAVYLGRLGPVAAYGPEQRTRSYRRGWFWLRKQVSRSFGFLEVAKLSELPPGDWNEEINEIKDKLRRFGFYLPSREELSKELPFPADISTNLGEQPYRVFDAVFYWYD
jgi:hypothetical protein